MDETRRVPAWSILIKPIEDCNLNCQYCYAKPFKEKYGKAKMTMETLDRIITLAENYAKEVNIIWHGGEPTLVGVDWYYKAQEILKKHDKTIFLQSIQTNGILLDESWAKLTEDTGIKVGVSFDVFDQNIRTSTMTTIENNIKKYLTQVENIGIISVINKKNYKKQIEIYEYFKNNFKGNISLSFNHIFTTNGTRENDLELTYSEYVEEFKKVLEYMLHDTSSKPLLERTCSTLIKQICGDRKLVCTYCDCTNCWMGITVNGDIYPCDRYVPDKYMLGNVFEINTVQDAYNSEGNKLYCLDRRERINNYCLQCGYLDYCQSGCNANHIASTGDNAHIDEFYCNQFKTNFLETYKILKEIDLFKGNINLNYFGYFVNESIFTFKEIKNILYENDLVIPETEDLNEANLLNSVEFKIFRIFNRYKGMKIDGHSDYIQIQNINTDFGDLDGIYSNRYKNIKLIFELQRDKIINLLGGD